MSDLRELTNVELDVVGGGTGSLTENFDVPIILNFGQMNGNGNVGVNNGLAAGFGGNNFHFTKNFFLSPV